MNSFSLSLISIIIILIIVSCGQLWANPIVNYTQGANGRAETVHAIIRAIDLRTGERTSKDRRLAAQIRAMGKPGDNCGHIVARVLGGPMKPYNLFPQNAEVNSGEFRDYVEDHMQKYLEIDSNDEHSVDYQVQLVYETPDDTRPTKLRFKISFLKALKLVPFTQIPRSRKHQVPSNPYEGIVRNP